MNTLTFIFLLLTLHIYQESDFFKIFIYYYLFLPALGLSHCLWAFSSYSKQGLLSSCRVWSSHYSISLVSEHKASRACTPEAAAHRLVTRGMTNLPRLGTKPSVPGIGRRILKLIITRKSQNHIYFHLYIIIL